MCEEFTITKLDAKPGDTLVIRVDHTLTREIADRIRAAVEPNLPELVKVLVIGKDVELSVLNGR